MEKNDNKKVIKFIDDLLMARKKFLSRNRVKYQLNYAAHFNVSFLDVVSEIVKPKMIYARY
jgi:hypothetical protein